MAACGDSLTALTADSYGSPPALEPDPDSPRSARVRGPRLGDLWSLTFWYYFQAGGFGDQAREGGTCVLAWSGSKRTQVWDRNSARYTDTLLVLEDGRFNPKPEFGTGPGRWIHFSGAALPSCGYQQSNAIF